MFCGHFIWECHAQGSSYNWNFTCWQKHTVFQKWIRGMSSFPSPWYNLPEGVIDIFKGWNTNESDYIELRLWKMSGGRCHGEDESSNYSQYIVGNKN